MLQCALLDVQCARTELAVLCRCLFRCTNVGSKALEMGMENCPHVSTLHDTYTMGAAAAHCRL